MNRTVVLSTCFVLALSSIVEGVRPLSSIVGVQRPPASSVLDPEEDWWLTIKPAWSPIPPVNLQWPGMTFFLPPQETTYIFLLNNHRIKDDRMENSINGSRYRHNLR